MSDQSIFKIHRQDREKFAVIENRTIRDERMSFKATGLLCYLLSLPDDWKASQTHLATVKTDGRDAVIAGFKELCELGYLEKIVMRDLMGRIQVTEWHVYEVPLSGLPETGLPETGLPETEKPTLRITKGEELQIKETNSDEFSESLFPPIQDPLKKHRNGNQSKDDKNATRAIREGQAMALLAAFPKPAGSKVAAMRTITAKLAGHSFETLLAAVKAYAEFKAGTEIIFVKSPENWFRDDCFLAVPTPTHVSVNGNNGRVASPVTMSASARRAADTGVIQR